MYRMVGNFCWVLIFVIFVVDLAVMKLPPTNINISTEIHVELLHEGHGQKHFGSTGKYSLVTIANWHPAMVFNIYSTSCCLSEFLCRSSSVMKKSRGPTVQDYKCVSITMFIVRATGYPPPPDSSQL